MKLVLTRDVLANEFTLGTLKADGRHIGFTCEDKDRRLENEGEKVYGRTAIPRGTYKVILTFSHRFQRVMPEVLNVPEFEGIRIHGGNTAEDSLGCPLLGLQRTQTGVAKCKEVNQKLIDMIQDCEDRGEPVTLEVV